MTPRRKPPILRENQRDNNNTRHDFSWQTLRTGPTADGPLAGSIKDLYRRAMKWLTGKEQPAPKPRKRIRSGTGEVGRAFRLAALGILRPNARTPVSSRAGTLVLDTLAWLHLWNWNDQSSGQEVEDKHSDHHDLFPHL
jgi:hypothetical protein